MDRIEPTRQIAFKIWWAIAWRIAVGTVAFGIVLGIVFAILKILLGLSDEFLNNVIPFFGMLIGIGVSVEVIFRILSKKFQDFEIALIPKQN